MVNIESLSTDAISKAEAYRRRKHTAVLAVMFTDMKDSTSIYEQMGELRFQSLRNEHDTLLQEMIEADDGGAVVQNLGDGILAVFAEPSVAVDRALRLQSQLKDHQYLRLRVGIDMGQVSLESEGGIVQRVLGRHVHRASRIESLAEAGHVLVSWQVYDCAVAWLMSPSIAWENHGLKALKGFQEPISVLEPYDPAYTRPQQGVAEGAKLAEVPVEAVVPSRAPASTVLVPPSAPWPQRSEPVVKQRQPPTPQHALWRPALAVTAVSLGMLALALVAVAAGQAGVTWEAALAVFIVLLGTLLVVTKVIVRRRRIRRGADVMRSSKRPSLPAAPTAPQPPAAQFDYWGPATTMLRPAPTLGRDDAWEPAGTSVGIPYRDRMPPASLRRDSNGDPLELIVSGIRQLTAYRRASVLWVDDYPENNRILMEMLESAGCHVEVATSTDDAMVLVMGRDWDVVITDMGRGTNPTAGLDLLMRLAGQSDVSAARIVFSSPTAVARYGPAAHQLSAWEVTSGGVTLLDAVGAWLAQGVVQKGPWS